MSDTLKSPNSSGKDVLAWLSFMTFIIVFLVGGFIWIGDFALSLAGPAADETAGLFGLVLIIAGGSLVGTVLIYTAGITWLCFAKLFFSRAEVEQVVFAGPTTFIERWLVDKSFPRSKP